MALLELQNLKVYYRTRMGQARAVDDVTFSVQAGGTLGLVGESGCGKTTIAKAIMRLLPKNGSIAGGRIMFNGRDLAVLNPDEIRRYRWEEIAMISQSAMNALNPVARIGEQLIEAMRAHRKVSRAQAEVRLAEVVRPGRDQPGAGPGLPSPVLRRDETAGGHRHGPAPGAGFDPGRRTDHRPGRPGSGSDHRQDKGAVEPA